MQKRLIATFMVALMLLTVLSAVSSANDISVSKETDEDKNSFRINIDWGTYGWRFDSSFHRHKHHTFIHIGGYKFRGIITPNFICGYFYNNWFNR